MQVGVCVCVWMCVCRAKKKLIKLKPKKKRMANIIQTPANHGVSENNAAEGKCTRALQVFVCLLVWRCCNRNIYINV